MVAKLIQSAIANAENNFSLNRDGLYIKSITCDMGPVLQRAFPRARGSALHYPPQDGSRKSGIGRKGSKKEENRKGG
ncbi:hypothetical protein IPM19_01240 [bacterium]|nr:MAG: hypothetical protein IPM19_01240 [bacterium]